MMWQWTWKYCLGLTATMLGALYFLLVSQQCDNGLLNTPEMKKLEAHAANPRGMWDEWFYPKPNEAPQVKQEPRYRVLMDDQHFGMIVPIGGGGGG